MLRMASQEVRLVEEVLSDEQKQQFQRYFELLVEWNEKMNLTGITEQKEVYIKHFYDSLSALDAPEWKKCRDNHGRVIDVGTGAGFPGLPLAIVSPKIPFVLCDALNKRVSFLREVVRELDLQNVEVIHARSEDLSKDSTYRNRFDIVVSRAVARLNVLLELTSPFARVGGHVVAYKGPGVIEELEDGRRAAKQLNCEIIRVDKVELPLQMGNHSLVFVKQMVPTPKRFPRKAGTPQKSPL